MKIYHYDPRTGEHRGTTNARPDPKEKGEFLIPRFATEAAPPTAKKDKTPVYDAEAGEWSLVTDKRGVTVYAANGTPEVIRTLGEEVGPERTETPPPGPGYVLEGSDWTPDLESLRTRAYDTLDQLFRNVMDSLVEGYPDRERETWSKQEAEARALLEDPDAPAPFIRAYAGQLPAEDAVLELRDAILAKAQAFEVATGTIIGRYKAYSEQIAAATDAGVLEDMEFVLWEGPE